jgi:hypothetical protein
MVLGTFVVLLAVGACSLFLLHPSAHAVPAKIIFSSNAIRALNGDGNTVWSYEFSQTIDPYYLSHPELLTKLVRIADLKGDGSREVIVGVPLQRGPNSGDMAISEISCFSSDGRLLWSYIPQETFRFGSYELRGPWWVFDIFVSNRSGKPMIWASLVHYEWGNSFVVQLDPTTGKATIRFVNTGIIFKLDEVQISGKPYLLAGGFNNEYAGGSLSVIDENRLFSVSPQTAGTRHKCVSCSDGAPDYYFVFPRSEINVARNLWEDAIEMISVNADGFEVWKMELGEAGRGTPLGVRSIYIFHTAPAPSPYAFRFDSGYDLLHNDLQHQGKLDHGLETCPERLHPQPVRVWTPAAGWSQAELPPTRAVD